MSTVFGALSVISLAVVLYLSYSKAGEAPINYGFSGILILIFAIVGMVLGVLALQEKERRFPGADDIVFVHTGGAAALFAMDLPNA